MNAKDRAHGLHWDVDPTEKMNPFGMLEFWRLRRLNTMAKLQQEREAQRQASRRKKFRPSGR